MGDRVVAGVGGASHATARIAASATCWFDVYEQKVATPPNRVAEIKNWQHPGTVAVAAASLQNSS